MKAAVCYEFNKPLVVEEVDLDPPERGEVKVRLAATAVCHSDIHAIKGELRGKLPGVPGHESAGYVEEVGENVTSVKPGDPVVVSAVTAGCGQCLNCTIGLRHMCQNRKPMEGHHRNKRGERLGPMAGPVGGFAEYTTVQEYQVVQVPKEMPLDRAALLACAVITGFGVVVNRAQVKPFSSVVVIGIGGVGLNAIQGAVFSGAYPVIAVDMLDNKLEAARSFGATHTINAGQEDVVKAVQQLTSERGADYVFVTVGSADAVRQGFAMLGPRGMTVNVGISTESLSFSPVEFLRGERMLTGCVMGSTRLSVDVPRLAALYQAGRLKLDELITDRYPLERINEAIDSMMRGEALRNVIVF